MKNTAYLLCAMLMASCGNSQTSNHNKSAHSRQTFAAARKSFKTHIIAPSKDGSEPEVPLAALFKLVSYPTDIGAMPAYLSIIPQDGQRRPAMIWLTGGWGNGIDDVWSPQEEEDDQSAAVIRASGIIMMYPAQRGGNTSPGSDETFYGEIDDIIAAARYLASQPGVDPKRIYLGGHSTGGTKAVLAAEASDIFRATFSFGPAPDVESYGSDQFTFDASNKQELELRAPVKWLSSLRTPLFVFEGTEGNYDALKYMQEVAEDEGNKLAHFYELKGHDHFSGLQRCSKVIAAKIISDSGAVTNISFTEQELD